MDYCRIEYKADVTFFSMSNIIQNMQPLNQKRIKSKK